MNAVGGVLDRHRGYQHHAGDDRLPRIAIVKRPETDRQHRAGDQQNDLQPENDFQRRAVDSQQRRTSEAPRVTKFPVTCAVNSPCSARKPAVSTKPALRLSSSGSVGFKLAAGIGRGSYQGSKQVSTGNLALFQ